MIIASGIRVIKEWERAPGSTPRPLHRLQRPRSLLHHSIRRSDSEHCFYAHTNDSRLEPNRPFTKDNVPVNVDAIMFFQAVDVEKSDFERRKVPRRDHFGRTDNACERSWAK